MGKTSLDVIKELGIRNVAVVRMPLQAHGAKNGRAMNIKSLPKGANSKTWLTEWVYDIGKQVRVGKNVVVFYKFIKENPQWPSINQVMAAIYAMGDIDQKRDTGMHNNFMDGRKI